MALRDEVGFFDRDTGKWDKLADVEKDVAETRLNDGKTGPDGAFWVGTFDDRPEKKPIGALYRVTADGRVEKRSPLLPPATGSVSRRRPT